MNDERQNTDMEKQHMNTESSELCVSIGTNSMICNTPDGIVHRRLMKEDIVDEILVGAQLVSPNIYEDAATHIKYITTYVKVVGSRIVVPITMMRVDSFVEWVNKWYRYQKRPKWDIIILNYTPHTRDIIVSGYVCPPHEYNLTCGIRDYFNAGLLKSVERHEARQVVERLLDVLDKFAPNNLWPKQMWSAITYGSFGNFMLTRKLHGLKAWFTAFVGPPNTGKSTAAYILLQTFFPRYAEELLVPVGRYITPARMRRLQSEVVTTLIALDNADVAMKRDEILDVLRTFATSLTTWVAGQAFPAYAGLILTANSPQLSDPVLQDRTIIIPITERIDHVKSHAFFAQVPRREELIKFGSYYLLYAERNWDSVKDIVLAENIYAPREYMKAVMEDLGLNMPELIGPDEPISSATTRLLSLIRNEAIKVASPGDQHNVDTITFLEDVIRKGMLKTARLYTRNGEEYVRIVREEVEKHGLNIDQLCKELGGEQLYKGGSYYKNCIVPWSQFLKSLLEFLQFKAEKNN